jgi:nitroimidazol reductase NimA-like FMN-containing flavoprotein (pyridoxamine 5'-phosphate oxidase superfamily)
VDAILDEGLFCHLGFLDRGQPVVIPTIHARLGDQVYVHGSTGSRAMRAVSPGAPVCLTVTILDGLVLARSAFNHSMNYRSVMVLGTAREVTDPQEKLAAMRAVVEHVALGRWAEVRAPTRKEVAATTIVALGLEEASAKVRTGPPHDDEEDLALSVWAGELPIALATGDPVDDPTMTSGLRVSPSVAAWRRP